MKTHRAPKTLVRVHLLALTAILSLAGTAFAQSPTGPAGGALTGNYPDPLLNVTGGPCANGQALTDISALAVLSCAPGVFAAGTNVAPGGSFPSLTTGFGNSALGFNALFKVTSGTQNSAVGDIALDKLTTGSNNSALGRNALGATTTGSSNVAVGQSASAFNSTGANNVALGDSAMAFNSTGTGNVAIGQAAGAATTGNNNIVIGNSGSGGESNTIRIGAVQTKAFIDGIRGVTTGAGNAIPVVIDSNGQLGTASSSRSLKRDIDQLGSLRALMKLRPVSFRYRSGPPELHYGLIAEQVAKVLPELAVYGKDGLPETVQYQELPSLLLAKIQDQQRQLNRQQAQIDWLMSRAGG